MSKINNVPINNSVQSATTTPTQGAKTSNARVYDDILNGTNKSSSIKKFGIVHYHYDDCKLADMISVDKVIVHKECAKAFKKMQDDAKKEGLNLKIVSGYRSSEYQIQVFKRKFNGQYPTDEQMKARLKYSAPSGYSEHHTGLAIDINETETRFKNTKEYKWLCEHAQEYGFELSFPENNAQGLGFEPWHWRYIGENGENKQIFEQARMNDPRFSEK